MGAKKPEKKKEEKKKEEESEEPAAPVEKKPDPFEKMPKGSFDMEEWKRFYSNNDEPELDDNWQIDHSSYTWRKLESKSDETKKLVDQYWKWEGTDEKGR